MGKMYHTGLIYSKGGLFYIRGGGVLHCSIVFKGGGGTFLVNWTKSDGNSQECGVVWLV